MLFQPSTRPENSITSTAMICQIVLTNEVSTAVTAFVLFAVNFVSSVNPSVSDVVSNAVKLLVA